MNNYLLLILGSYTDEFHKATNWPIEGTYAETFDLGRRAGGPPLNMGCVCASKGGIVRSLDYMSDAQESTKFLISTLNSYGVNTDDVMYGDVINGKVVIFNTGDKRTMFVVNPQRPYYKITDELQGLLNNADYIYSLMHIINRSFENIEPLKIARSHGAKIILDGSSAYTKDWERNILYSLCNGLFINADDYNNLSSHTDGDPKELLFNNGCEFICITDGEKGATCYTKDNVYKAESIKTEVVDSTGAGDSFAGTFVYGLQKGFSYEKCLRLACVAGSYACTAIGGQAACCSIDELLAYAKKNNYRID